MLLMCICGVLIILEYNIKEYSSKNMMETLKIFLKINKNKVLNT